MQYRTVTPFISLNAKIYLNQPKTCASDLHSVNRWTDIGITLACNALCVCTDMLQHKFQPTIYRSKDFVP